MMIGEFNDGMRIKGQFIVSNVSKGVNVSGMQYLNVELKDASGTIPGKKWESTAADEALYIVGNVIEVEGEVIKYKETLQLKILAATPVSSDEVDVTKFVKAPPIPKEELIDIQSNIAINNLSLDYENKNVNRDYFDNTGYSLCICESRKGGY